MISGVAAVAADVGEDRHCRPATPPPWDVGEGRSSGPAEAGAGVGAPRTTCYWIRSEIGLTMST